MNNPKYFVSISHVPGRNSGQSHFYTSGVTYSIPTYTDEYFYAAMPELDISATGSSHIESLANLMIIATASTTLSSGMPPIGDTKTW